MIVRKVPLSFSGIYFFGGLFCLLVVVVVVFCSLNLAKTNCFDI